jgi:hypothetical protein
MMKIELVNSLSKGLQAFANDAQTIKGQKSLENSITDLAKSDLITNRSIEAIYFDENKLESQA